MPDFRRWFVPGGTYFFTLVTAGRARILCEPPARECLRTAWKECRRRWPFTTVGVVLLPDHLHAVWALPRGDADFSRRWAFLKWRFTRSWLARQGSEQAVTRAHREQRRRGVWQPRFWEHFVRDEGDLERHVDYVVFNPVKHGLVSRPADWPSSSFHRFVREGHYPPDWGRQAGLMDFSDIEESARE